MNQINFKGYERINEARYCYYGNTKKEALTAFRKSFGSFKGFVKKENQIKYYNYGKIRLFCSG